MIIQTGMRTDIPAFYSEWLLNRIREGTELEPYGADCSGCLTVNTYETALHSRLHVPKRKNNQRKGQCVCLLGLKVEDFPVIKSLFLQKFTLDNQP